MRCVAIGWLIDDAFVLVKNLQAVYIYTRMQITESPIFDASFLVRKRGFVPAMRA
jgi:hypothetical protein